VEASGCAHAAHKDAIVMAKPALQSDLLFLARRESGMVWSLKG